MLLFSIVFHAVHDFSHTMEFQLPIFFYISFLCSTEERNSCRFGTTWGWVNDDRIFIFGWTVPLKPLVYVFKTNKQIHLLKSLMQKMKAVNLSFLITKSDQNDCNESCTLSLSEKANLECRSFDYIFNWLTALQRWIILMWARFICHLTVK